MERTLLLSALYEPIQVISWQRAMHLFFLGKVEILDHYDRKIGSASVDLHVPCVVRLLKYVYTRRLYRRAAYSRQGVFVRDRFHCQYCGRKFGPKDLTLDHVVPASKGGETSFHNLVAACLTCNMRKADRTPEQARMGLKVHDSGPQWPLAVSLLLSAPTRPSSWDPYLFDAR